MGHLFRNIIIVLFLFTAALAQSPPEAENSFYQSGMELLKNHNTGEAEDMFKKSIRKFSDAPSMFELAKLYRDKNTISGRDRARELVQKAIWKDPKNIDYRMLQASLAEKFGPSMAFGIYEEITEIDSSYAKAWFNMGRIKEADFNEYHNSVSMEDYSSPLLSYERFALEDMQEAEGYFRKALHFDPKNQDARLHMAFLYEDANMLDKAIPLLQEMSRIDSTSKDAHLYLGLIYYKTSKIKMSYEEYKKALKLMSYDEEVDFTFNSVKELLEPLLGDEYKKLTKDELKEIIDLYWKVNDPLNLTEYNERLLEHYSRVAYANLRFTSKTDGTPGWKTDKGEVVLRYGEPVRRIRYRPQIVGGERMSVKVKTDVWDYNGLTFGFTDEYMSGNYHFSVPNPYSRYIPQYPGDSQRLMEYLRKVKYEDYKPKYDGPAFTLPYYIAQFKNMDSDKSEKTDLCISYAMSFPDSIVKNKKFTSAHSYGIFFTDKNYDPQFQKKNSVGELPEKNKISIPSSEEYYVNTVSVTVSPDSGILAFEVLRGIDNGVSSSHKRFKIKDFLPAEFSMSDLLLAAGAGNLENAPLKRKDIGILPNPTNTFTKSQNLFLYYEVYNLRLTSDHKTDFEQKITIKNAEEESGLKKIFNAITGILGFKGSKEEVSLTSRYQTAEKDPQMYIQLDMSEYEPGDYIVRTVIKDKLSQKEASSETLLHWR
ncbi:MAG: GWxTD domain-containing protein [Candidatus Aminicenantes bacterium]